MALPYKLTIVETTVGEDRAYAEFAYPIPVDDIWQFADIQLDRLRAENIDSPDLVFEARLFRTHDDIQITRPEPPEEQQ